jgi:hypothetical protein
MSVPCLRRPGRSCAALAALVLSVCTGAVFAAGESNDLTNFGLRPTLSAQKKNTSSRTAEANDVQFGTPPGSGAGDTGFMSQKKRKAAKQKKAAVAIPEATSHVTGPIQSRIGKLNPPVASLTSPLPLKRKKIEDDPFGPVGFHAGAFLLKPSIEVSSGYDDNPFRVPNGPGSIFTIVKSQLNANSEWSRHEISLDLRGSYTAYENVEHNNRPDAEAVLRGRIDVAKDRRIEFEERAVLATQAPGTPDAVTGAKRPPFIYTFGSSAGFIQQFNRFELGLYGGVERTIYQDAELISGGSLDLSDSNYNTYSTRLRGSYEVTPGMKPFVEVGIDTRKFDNEINSFGVVQGSNGFKGRVGVAFDRPEIIKGEASVGYISRSYNDPTVQDISGILVDSSLVWRATPLTKVTLNVNTSINESTTTDAVGIFTREAKLAIDHSFRRWLVGSVFGSYGEDNYRGANRVDHRMTYGAALTYSLSRALALRGEVRQERLLSNVPDQDYTANIAMIGLRLQQ